MLYTIFLFIGPIIIGFIIGYIIGEITKNKTR